MALDSTTLSNLRLDLGDNNTPPAFSDARLQANYDRYTSAPNDYVHFQATLAISYWQLLAESSLFADYTAGQVSENLDQIWKHIQYMYGLLAPFLDAAAGQNRQLLISKLGKRDRRERTRPYEDFDVSVNRISNGQQTTP